MGPMIIGRRRRWRRGICERDAGKRFAGGRFAGGCGAVACSVIGVFNPRGHGVPTLRDTLRIAFRMMLPSMGTRHAPGSYELAVGGDSFCVNLPITVTVSMDSTRFARRRLIFCL